MEEDSEREERVDDISYQDQKDVVESCAMVLLVSVCLLLHVPVLSIEIRDQGPETDEEYDFGSVAEEDEPDGESK